MADILTVIEDCRISPTPETVGERSLTLTFFDLLWLTFPPSHQLFMYELPHSKTHFIGSIIPNLKNSLSITLAHFFPFASNLIVFPNSRKPEIRHVEGDSVAFRVAECSLDFNDLVGNHPRACDKFHPLVPRLGRATKVSNHVTIPLFSVQVTLFPNSGISIGVTSHHTLCDATTIFDFLKAWTAIARHGTDELFLASESLPFYDRVIKYPDSLDEIFMNAPGIESLHADCYQPTHLASNTNKVQAAFVFTRSHISRMKMWLLDQTPRVDFPTKTTLLASNKGFLTALQLHGKAISETMKNKAGLIKDAEKWIERRHVPVSTTGVAGSPKIKVYDIDFGWGKPAKYEFVSTDYNGSISVNQCKDSPEDLEIGLCLPAKQMDAFIEWKKFCCCLYVVVIAIVVAGSVVGVSVVGGGVIGVVDVGVGVGVGSGGGGVVVGVGVGVGVGGGGGAAAALITTIQRLTWNEQFT
ncbi:hypothetical protein L1987_12750 [Smallanthus sonchifolius]|uniref:Uncharacterized protein n=1 Tax=Smallanthus sonchifolius TaxID=185202 RepID=A0ACB9JFG1_9ASTR|nr:hypothetical protein L1987_12750 [Smallanthus sonchifolius]